MSSEQMERELLELAARAAGLEVVSQGADFWLAEDGVSIKHWNPLTDDGDALRLAVKLGMRVSIDTFEDRETTAQVTHRAECEAHRGDPCKATRRAIVRAAAAFAKARDGDGNER